MKTNLIGFFVLVIVVFTACSPGASIPLQQNIVTSAIPTLTKLPVSTITPDMAPRVPTSTTSIGFTQPEPNTWVMLMPAVQEYFYYRKRAVAAGDIKILWEHYPELKNGADISKGINAEQSIVASYQGLKPFDGNVFPEEYEQIKVKMPDNEAEVLVHGMELYLWSDAKGNFTSSGGEFKIILYLKLKQRNDRWQLYKTDEVTMAEWHDFAP
jgi:hypothetical protein